MSQTQMCLRSRDDEFVILEDPLKMRVNAPGPAWPHKLCDSCGVCVLFVIDLDRDGQQAEIHRIQPDAASINSGAGLW